MPMSLALASILGRLNPALWDVIVPMGPIFQLSRAARGQAFTRSSQAAAELNPQPIPPGSEQLLFASAVVAHDIAFAAISAEAAGTDAAKRIVSTAIDDWCGTGRPRPPIPWPWPFPFPWPPDPEPHPEWDLAASRVVGALTLASVAVRMQDGPARQALEAGADRLLETGLGSAR